MQQDWLLSLGLPLALFTILLGMGLTLSVQDFLRVRQAPKAVALGLSGQFLLPPLAALLAIALLQPEPIYAVGLLILSFAPSGATSNLMTFLARGDVALSVTLTAITSLIVPFTLPLLSALALHWGLGQTEAIHLPLLRTWAQLLLISLLPILLGMSIAAYWPSFAKRLIPALRPASLLFLLGVLIAITHNNWGQMPGFLRATAPAVILMNVTAIGLGWAWASVWRLPHAQQTTLGLEVGVQNGGTALVITLLVLNNAQLSIAPVIYGILMLFPGLAFGWLMAQYEPQSSSGSAHLSIKGERHE